MHTNKEQLFERIYSSIKNNTTLWWSKEKNSMKTSFDMFYITLVIPFQLFTFKRKIKIYLQPKKEWYNSEMFVVNISKERYKELRTIFKEEYFEQQRLFRTKREDRSKRIINDVADHFK